MRIHLLRFFASVLCAVACATVGQAQIITSLVGGISADGLRARETPLVFPRAVAIDQDGYIYIADDGSRIVRRIDPATGIATVIAGGGPVVDDLVPVAGKAAYLNSPVGLALGSGRNLYIVDDANNRIRVLTPSGSITTVAGNGDDGFSGDGGPATRATMTLPSGVAVDSAGNLYITDRENRAIRKVNAATGVITTLAGGPNATRTGNGIPAKEARLLAPWGIAVDAAGNVFFADEDDYVVHKIEAATGLIRTVAGTGSCCYDGDNGPATSAKLSSPKGVAVAPNGDLYIGVYRRVRKVSAATGIITTVLGAGNWILSEGRPGTDVWFSGTAAQLALTANNTLLIALQSDNLIAKLDLNTGGVFSIVAGSRTAVGDGGPAAAAAIAQPQKLALDATGNLFIADRFHHRIRRVAPGTGGAGTGTISTVAGDGYPNFTADGSPAADSSIWYPGGLFVDSSNRLYFTDYWSMVRRVGSDGILRTVAGTTDTGFGGDGGPATAAKLDNPEAVIVDNNGNIYIADSGNNRVRKVDTAGVIRTIAGTGEAGYSGDGGPATAAKLNWPNDLLLDSGNGLLIADYYNHRVRRVDLSTGIITTFAGIGRRVFSGDGGPATAAGISQPRGLAKDSQGNIYATGINSVRRIDAVTGIITTVAGGTDPGFTGDGGLATLARLSGVQGIIVDGAGNILFSDAVNDRVRRVSAAAVVPLLAVSPTALSFSAVQGGASPVEQSLQISTTNLARASWTASVTLSSGSGWLSIQPTAGVTPGTLQVAVNSSALAAGTYSGSITITAAGAGNSPQTVPVTLTVTAGGNARLAVDRQFITFRAAQGGSSPPAQIVQLSNAGGGVLQWQATVQTSNGGNWLSISPASGTGATTLTLSVTLGSLPVGVYQGLILLSNRATAQSEALSVSFIVSQPVSSLLLSQTGALFTANQGASFVRPETISVVNAGQGAMSWQAQAISLSGSEWLTVTPSGSSSGGASAPLILSPNPGGLSPGVYDALVTITAPGATNSPQTLLSRIIVQSAGTPPVGNIRPGGMALVAAAGGGTQQDSLTISTSGGSTLSFVVSASTSDGKAWLSVSPSGGTLQGSSNLATLTVQANPSQLTAGFYRGKVTVSFSTGVTQDVGVLLVVTPPGSGVAAQEAEPQTGLPPTNAACTPAEQFPLHTTLLNNFSLPSGWATPVVARVLDNCGGAVTNSVVVATFSGGDDALILRSLGTGFYSGMWNPSKPGANTITLLATGSGLQARKSETITVSVGAGTPGAETPLIFRNGAVNGASFKKFAPLAPGQIFSLFGSNLATGESGASTLPLPRTLGGVTAKLAGKDLPLYYSNKGQVNAQVPFDLPPGGTFGLVVTQGRMASPPESITLTNSQPGIFTANSSGSGPGAITNTEGAQISSSNPARRGNFIIVYATGLGATNPPVPTGEASPSNPPARVIDGVTAYIGGAAVPVDFAGMTPGFVGLYQVNVRIPDSAPLGDAVELYLEQNQISSNKVTLVIQ